jgi:lipoprotein NlpD
MSASINSLDMMHNFKKYLPHILCLLLASCSQHQPAPVEEHSLSSRKSALSADGSYVVGKGDTLYAIAFKYDVDPHDVAKWNGITSPYVIHPGQSLRLSPSSSNSRSSARSRATSGANSVQISPVKTPGQASTRAVTTPSVAPQQKPVPEKTSPPPPPPPSSSTNKTAAPTQTAASSSVSPSSWNWPTDGRLIRGYVAGDPARNGLDIAGKEGQSVKATSSGQVVYSGSGLIGYGELIIIKHNDKFLSAYAHNKQRLVSEGDQVSSGQKIAEMGRNPAGDQILHFEIRANGKPVNPLTYLPKK